MNKSVAIKAAVLLAASAIGTTVLMGAGSAPAFADEGEGCTYVWSSTAGVYITHCE